VRGLAGKRSAVMLANHGPVVAGKDVEAACNAIEELEDTARLAVLMRGIPARMLSDAQVQDLVTQQALMLLSVIGRMRLIRPTSPPH